MCEKSTNFRKASKKAPTFAMDFFLAIFPAVFLGFYAFPPPPLRICQEKVGFLRLTIVNPTSCRGDNILIIPAPDYIKKVIIGTRVAETEVQNSCMQHACLPSIRFFTHNQPRVFIRISQRNRFKKSPPKIILIPFFAFLMYDTPPTTWDKKLS